MTVTLNAFDALSGVAATFYTLNGGAQQSGSSVSIGAGGMHTLQFWSVDNAGNAESPRTVQVKIDKTPPISRIPRRHPSTLLAGTTPT